MAHLRFYSITAAFMCGVCCFPPAFLEAAELNLPQLLKTFRDEFVVITPGQGKFPQSFSMGSEAGTKAEQPIHTVTLSAPFAIGKYEVPQNLYAAIMGNNPARWKGPRNSVEQMTWAEAQQFCEKVTVQLKAAKLIEEAEMVRLPTEAEWEYCCRAGTETAYSFGEKAQLETDKAPQASLLDPYAWHTGNAAGNDPAVGALKPNPWGLYDMHGYLWEFCADTWQPNYEDVPSNGDEVFNAEAEQCVIRGGSWRDAFPRLRCSARSGFPINSRSDAVGLRCVLVQVAPAAQGE